MALDKKLSTGSNNSSSGAPSTKALYVDGRSTPSTIAQPQLQPTPTASRDDLFFAQMHAENSTQARPNLIGQTSLQTTRALALSNPHFFSGRACGAVPTRHTYTLTVDLSHLSAEMRRPAYELLEQLAHRLGQKIIFQHNHASQQIKIEFESLAKLDAFLGNHQHNGIGLRQLGISSGLPNELAGFMHAVYTFALAETAECMREQQRGIDPTRPGLAY